MSLKSTKPMYLYTAGFNSDSDFVFCLMKAKFILNKKNTDDYSRITLVVPNYEVAPRLFYSEYFWQRYMTCSSAAHEEFPMGIISSIWSKLCESITGQRANGLLVNFYS